MIHFYLYNHPHRWAGHYIVRLPDRSLWAVPMRPQGWQAKHAFVGFLSSCHEAGVDAEAEAARLGIPWDAAPDLGLAPEIAAIFQTREGAEEC